MEEDEETVAATFDRLQFTARKLFRAGPQLSIFSPKITRPGYNTLNPYRSAFFFRRDLPYF
jgi:hypothetical protein